jgi:hypothetical protein
MFRKTKVRQILELLHKNLSAREISKTLKVSRNSVAFVKESYDRCDKDWDEICLMNDDEIYQLFYPHTFRPRNRFAPVDYSYVHSELKKVGVTEMLLWEEYCEKCNAQGVPHCCYTSNNFIFRSILSFQFGTINDKTFIFRSFFMRAKP